MKARVKYASDRLLRAWQLGVPNAAKGRRTGGWACQPNEDPHSGGLACAIRPEESSHMSRLNDKAQIAYGERSVVALDQSVDNDRGYFMINNSARRTGTAYLWRSGTAGSRLRESRALNWWSRTNGWPGLRSGLGSSSRRPLRCVSSLVRQPGRHHNGSRRGDRRRRRGCDRGWLRSRYWRLRCWHRRRHRYSGLHWRRRISARHWRRGRRCRRRQWRSERWERRR